jgi:[NiFe] hydrogenase assembly HybE family chaperone
VNDDPGSGALAEAAMIGARTQALVTDFTEVWHGKMRDLPMVNALLHVQAVGFQLHEGRPLGVLISPWFMNLVMLPAEGEDWSALVPGAKEVIGFASGEYEFIHNVRETVGGYKACSLFSPMGEFRTQAQAVDVARAVMVALFQDEHRAGTDRAADIRAAREAEMAALEAPDEALPEAPTRRQVISAGLAGEG